MNGDEVLSALRRDSRAESSDVRQRVARILMERSDPESLELLVELAGDADWRVRKAAIEGLEANPTEEVVRLLIPALFDPANAGRRNAAGEALGALGARALPFLVRELARATDADQRIALAGVLGAVPSEESLSSLVILTGNADVNVAAAAIMALGRLGRPEAVGPLVDVLAGENAWLHYHAIEALGRLRAGDALPAIVARGQNPALRKAVYEAAGTIGGLAAIDYLTAQLARTEAPDFSLLRALATADEAPRPSLLVAREHAHMVRKFREWCTAGLRARLLETFSKTQRPDRRADLLRAFGWGGFAEAVPVLAAQLTGEQAEPAERALADIGAPAFATLLSLLTPAADERQAEAILRLFSRQPPADGAPAVLAVLEHDSPVVRRAAAEVLGKLSEIRAVPYLAAHLADGDGGVDDASVRALAEIARGARGGAAAVEDAARFAAGSPDPLSRANALDVLARIGSDELRPRLLLASKDADAVVRARAVVLSGKAKDPSLAPVAEQALTDESAHVRQAAIAALAAAAQPKYERAFAAALQDEDLWVRAAACRALGSAPGPEASAELMRMASRGTPPERIAALEALSRVGGGEAWPAISAALGDADPEIREAALRGAAAVRAPAAQEEVVRRCSDPDWRLRATAIEALGRLGRRDKKGVVLRALHEDGDDVVARSALSALEMLAGPEDVPDFVGALSRPPLAEDVCEILRRLRARFPAEIEAAWREADARRAAVLAEILRDGAGS